MKISSHKVNVQTIRKLKDGEGLTLKHGKPVTYKTGWQVAVNGAIAHSPEKSNALY